MMRIDRYILRELIVPFLIGTVAVVLMFIANDLIAQFKQFQLQSVPMKAVLQIVFYKTPQFLQTTLPVGTALAASLAIFRLVRESEVTALRASGVPIFRILRPILGAGVLVAISSFLLVERVVPTSLARAKKVQTEASILGSGPQFRSNVILNLRQYVVSLGTVAGSHDNTIQLSEVLLIRKPEPGVTELITAKSGSYKDGVWLLRDTYYRLLSNDVLVDARPGSDVTINERIVLGDFFVSPESPELTTTEMRKAIKERKNAGTDTTMMEVDYHSKYALPAACAILALVGPMFALRLSRSGAFTGVLLSIIIVLLYYNAFIISTQILGRNGIVNPWLAAWLPNIIFLVLGIVAIRRLE